MRDSILFRAAARLIVPLQLFLSLVLLLRGHNEPGGGFIGGLVAGSALILLGIAGESQEAVRRLPLRAGGLIGGGLLCAAASGIPALWSDLPYMTGLWDGSIPTLVAGDLKLGTPFFFDVGVYLLVVGVTVLIVFSSAEEE